MQYMQYCWNICPIIFCVLISVSLYSLKHLSHWMIVWLGTFFKPCVSFLCFIYSAFFFFCIASRFAASIFAIMWSASISASMMLIMIPIINANISFIYLNTSPYIEFKNLFECIIQNIHISCYFIIDNCINVKGFYLDNEVLSYLYSYHKENNNLQILGTYEKSILCKFSK